MARYRRRPRTIAPAHVPRRDRARSGAIGVLPEW
jgi:hypothetical protein